MPDVAIPRTFRKLSGIAPQAFPSVTTPVVLRAANQNESIAGGNRTIIWCALARNDISFWRNYYGTEIHCRLGE